MSTEFITSIVERLIGNGFVDEENPLIGCSNLEIEEMERVFQVKLPAAYKAFLAAIGRSSGDFLTGEDFQYPKLLNLRESAQELLADSATTFRLSPTDFVFGMSGGSQFLFFDTASGDDPAVFHYAEDEPEPEYKCDHYSEALAALLQDSIESKKYVESLSVSNQKD